jgi:hypothetical protein
VKVNLGRHGVVSWDGRNTGATLPWGTFSSDVEGCDECNRTEARPWAIFTINYHGEECCAKCLTPMRLSRRRKA